MMRRGGVCVNSSAIAALSALIVFLVAVVVQSDSLVHVQPGNGSIPELLESFSESLLEDQAETALGALSPAADVTFRRYLNSTIESLTGSHTGRLELSSLAMRLSASSASMVGAKIDESASARAKAAGCADLRRALVSISYSLGGGSVPGLAEQPVVVDRIFDFTKCGSGWSVADVQRRAQDPALPWEIPFVRAEDVVTHRGVSTVLRYAGSEATAGRIVANLPAAIDDVADFWGGRGAIAAVCVVVTETLSQMNALVPSWRAGIQPSAVSTGLMVGRHFLNQRLIFAPGAASLSDGSLQALLRHELTHIAVAAKTNPTSPIWVREGIAEYVGRRGTFEALSEVAPQLMSEVASGAVPRSLPSDEDFIRSGPDALLAYQKSWSFMVYVARAFGSEKLKQLFDAINIQGSLNIDGSFRRVLGVGERTILRQWSKWLLAAR